MGCYPSGGGFDVMSNGLTLAMVNALTTTPLNLYVTSNGYYLVRYASMTLELCISICAKYLLNYAGLQTHSGTEYKKFSL